MSRRRQKLEKKYNKYIQEQIADGQDKDAILQNIIKQETAGLGFLSPLWIWLIKNILILIINNIFSKQKK